MLRIIGLTARAEDSPTLDNLRTYFILETDYDAIADTIRVVPDRAAHTLSILLARQGVEVGR